jgi:putative intracellular protease/amidase
LLQIIGEGKFNKSDCKEVIILKIKEIDKRFVKFVQDMHEQKKPIAAICHGPWMLCSAKILKNVKCTSFIAIKDDVENAGGEW